MIYLDNAATTFPKPEEVLDAVNNCQRNYAVNVGRGTYPLATFASEVVEETRSMLASLLHSTSPDQVIFTPSATIAANEVIGGLDWDPFKTVYVSPFEHNAIVRPLNLVCSKYGIKIRFIPFDSQTQEWNKEETEQLFNSDPPDYVFLNHVSNVTGLILPIREISILAKKHCDCSVIVDASQSIGLVDINLERDKIDYLIFAGHKNLYASWGIGGFVSSKMKLHSFIAGGTGSDSLNLSMGESLPVRFEAGSPNIIAIASLNASLKWLKSIGMDTIAKKKNELMSQLIAGLTLPNVTMYLPKDKAMHTSVLSINISDYLPNEVGVILGEDFNIAVRTGFHCAPFVHKFLHTEDKLGTVRISTGFFNTDKDIDALIRAINEI